MREDLAIRNFADEPALCTVEVFVGSDFADLFAVKEGRVGTDAAGESCPPLSPRSPGDGARPRPGDQPPGGDQGDAATGRS